MNRLFTELQRLYRLPEQPLPDTAAGKATPAFQTLKAGNMSRALVIGFERSSDWKLVAELFQAVQEDLNLPAPAVSVSGSDGYQLWFSLVVPVPGEQIRHFFNALRHSFLQELPPDHLRFWPDNATSLKNRPSPLMMPPALDPVSGKWSAFIDPGMGSMFSEAPGLEMMPVLDRQADLLAGLDSIPPGDFAQALNRLQELAENSPPPAAPEAGNTRASSPQAAQASSLKSVTRPFSEPKSFLLAVMNDPTVSLEHRIEAAKALLPYVDQTGN